MYAQLFGFANYLSKYFFKKKSGEFEVVELSYSMTANGQGVVQMGRSQILLLITAVNL